MSEYVYGREIRAGCHRTDFGGLVINFHEIDEHGQVTRVFTDGEWKEVGENKSILFMSHTGFVLNERQGQRFMDRLWDMGMRPTQDHIAQGAVPAQKNHIVDLEIEVAFLRTVVNKLLEREHTIDLGILGIGTR